MLWTGALQHAGGLFTGGGLDRGGYIAHNRALQNMLGMSQKVGRNAANSAARPSWLKGAAVASAMAGLPAAAGVEEQSGVATGAQYLTQGARGAVTVSAPITLTINGNVDQSVMPELKAALAEVEERIMARLSDEARADRRREHG